MEEYCRVVSLIFMPFPLSPLTETYCLHSYPEVDIVINTQTKNKAANSTKV